MAEKRLSFLFSFYFISLYTFFLAQVIKKKRLQTPLQVGGDGGGVALPLHQDSDSPPLSLQGERGRVELETSKMKRGVEAERELRLHLGEETAVTEDCFFSLSPKTHARGSLPSCPQTNLAERLSGRRRPGALATRSLARA